MSISPIFNKKSHFTIRSLSSSSTESPSHNIKQMTAASEFFPGNAQTYAEIKNCSAAAKAPLQAAGLPPRILEAMVARLGYNDPADLALMEDAEVAELKLRPLDEKKLRRLIATAKNSGLNSPLASRRSLGGLAVEDSVGAPLPFHTSPDGPATPEADTTDENGDTLPPLGQSVTPRTSMQDDGPRKLTYNSSGLPIMPKLAMSARSGGDSALGSFASRLPTVPSRSGGGFGTAADVSILMQITTSDLDDLSSCLTNYAMYPQPITIDLGGRTLAGQLAEDAAAVMVERDDVTIKNGTLQLTGQQSVIVTGRNIAFKEVKIEQVEVDLIQEMMQKMAAVTVEVEPPAAPAGETETATDNAANTEGELPAESSDAPVPESNGNTSLEDAPAEAEIEQAPIPDAPVSEAEHPGDEHLTMTNLVEVPAALAQPQALLLVRGGQLQMDGCRLINQSTDRVALEIVNAGQVRCADTRIYGKPGCQFHVLVSGDGDELDTRDKTVFSCPGAVAIIVGSKASLKMMDSQIDQGRLGVLVQGAGAHAALTMCTIQCGTEVRKNGVAELDTCQLSNGRGSGLLVSDQGSSASATQCNIRGPDIRDMASSGSAGAIGEAAAAVLFGGLLDLSDTKVYASKAGHSLEVRGAGATAVALHSSFFDSRGSGVAVLDGGSASIEDCELYASKVASGLEVVGAGSRGVARNCNLKSNKRQGAIAADGGVIELSQCRLVNNGQHGLRVTGGSSATASGCNFNANYDCAVLADFKGHAELSNCSMLASRKFSAAVEHLGSSLNMAACSFDKPPKRFDDYASLDVAPTAQHLPMSKSVPTASSDDIRVTVRAGEPAVNKSSSFASTPLATTPRSSSARFFSKLVSGPPPAKSNLKPMGVPGSRALGEDEDGKVTMTCGNLVWSGRKAV